MGVYQAQSGLARRWRRRVTQAPAVCPLVSGGAVGACIGAARGRGERARVKAGHLAVPLQAAPSCHCARAVRGRGAPKYAERCLLGERVCARARKGCTALHERGGVGSRCLARSRPRWCCYTTAVAPLSTHWVARRPQGWDARAPSCGRTKRSPFRPFLAIYARRAMGYNGTVDSRVAMERVRVSGGGGCAASALFEKGTCITSS